MNEAEIQRFLIAYRKGATADYLQPQINGVYGTYWTIQPCDPAAAERAGRQMLRMGATNIRWVRRARLRGGTGDSFDVLIALTLPNEQQDVIAISTGKTLRLDGILIDKSYTLLKAAFMPELTDLS